MSKIDWKTRFQYIIWPRITKPLHFTGDFLLRIFTVYRAAFFLTLIAIGIWYYTQVGLDELWPNIIPELLSIALTVFIIDTLNKRHAEDETKKILIEQLKSQNNAVASQALAEMEARGWLWRGVLRGVYLASSNLDNNSFINVDFKRVNFSFASLKNTNWFETDLEDAVLHQVDLHGATLSVHAVGPYYAEANLKNARITNSNLFGVSVRNEQLVQLNSLLHTIMPNGELYDGRFNLSGDIEFFKRTAIDAKDPNEWALFYGVTVEKFLAGQLWTQQNSSLFVHAKKES